MSIFSPPRSRSPGNRKKNGEGRSTLTFIDRRHDKRLRPSNGSVVIPSSEPSRECKLVDIGKNGLSFYSNGEEKITREFAALAIRIVDHGFNLSDIPCRVVSQSTSVDDYASDCKDLKRLSVQFGELTRNQKDRLEYYIKKHTVAVES